MRTTRQDDGEASAPLAPSSAASGRPRGSLRVQRAAYRIALVAITLVGLGLRELNARSAIVHDDELHYVADATWAMSRLRVRDAIAFLYDHPRAHPRLEPGVGIIGPWGTHGDFPRLGHPCLYAELTGIVVALRRPAWPTGAVRTGRAVNAIADAAVIPLLPTLVTTLGGSPAGGLASAALYAVFPPAVTYGSLGYLDPFLAPLMVLLVLALARHDGGRRSWLRIGVVSGLLLAVKETGLIALVFVPLVTLAGARRHMGGLVLWLLVSLGVTAIFTNPVAYLESIRHPLDPYYTPRFEPLVSLVGNLRLAMDPLAYYWLGFRKHGQPLAPLMARLHPLVTPAYLAVFAAGLVVVAAKRRRVALLLLYLPSLLTLVIVPPADGMWRLHLLYPLVCAAIGVAVARSGRRLGLVLAVVAVIAATRAVLPARRAAGGEIDLGDLLFMNPQVHQPPGFYSPMKRPLAIGLRAGEGLGRLLWLAPGRYDVRVSASATTAVALDGETVVGAPGTINVTGFVHRLEVRMMSRGVLTSIAITPAEGASDRERAA